MTLEINRKNDFLLRLGYWFVIGYAVFMLGLILAGIILFPAYAHQHAGDYTLSQAWTSAQTQAALQDLKWPAESVGWFSFGLDLIIFGVGFTLSLILLRRKARDGFGLFLAVIFLSAGNTGTILQPVLIHLPGSINYFFNHVIGVISWQFFFIAFFLFPNGKLVPGWTRWVILAWFGYMFWTLLNPAPEDHPMFWVAFVLVFCALGSQVYRQLTLKDPVQRLQTKWVAYAIGVVGVVIIYLTAAGFKPPNPLNLAEDLILAIIQQFVASSMFIVFMVALLVAILKYRLYDIDLIIRRTLQYSLLTGLLALIYFGSVVLGQRLGGALTGSPDSPLVLVISTLVMAALFNPLRMRVQDFIDRRFYRRKYDAQKMLEGFASHLRDEMELDQLSNHLVSVVDESMQPQQVIFWLKRNTNKLPLPELDTGARPTQ